MYTAIKGHLMITITISDERGVGNQTAVRTLDFQSETVSVRELIRRRVYDEVNDYNAKLPESFRGLVQPTDAERALNGYRLKTRRKLDGEAQYARALQGFEARGFLVLVDDRQVADLDAEIILRPGTEVTFLQLVPLIGG